MKESDSPLVFWDYCAERRARFHNLTAKDLFQLQGKNPMSATLGEEGDISNLYMFNWYDWCYFFEQGQSFPEQKEILGKVLGPTKDVCNHIILMERLCLEEPLGLLSLKNWQQVMKLRQRSDVGSQTLSSASMVIL